MLTLQILSLLRERKLKSEIIKLHGTEKNFDECYAEALEMRVSDFNSTNEVRHLLTCIIEIAMETTEKTPAILEVIRKTSLNILDLIPVTASKELEFEMQLIQGIEKADEIANVCIELNSGVIDITMFQQKIKSLIKEENNNNEIKIIG